CRGSWRPAKRCRKPRRPETRMSCWMLPRSCPTPARPATTSIATSISRAGSAAASRNSDRHRVQMRRGGAQTLHSPVASKGGHMNVRPSVLCPIDYSDASAGALRHAAAIAYHFSARVIVFVVENPLPIDLGAGDYRPRTTSKQELSAFVTSVFGDDAA